MNTAQTTPLNPAQIHLLRMFNYTKSEQEFAELKNVLFKYYRNKLDKLTDEYWETHNLNNDIMEEWANEQDREVHK
ncbi:MAG: hypothetical protein LBG17_03625 [Bacteroidales bacterium]|jgi:hypothetical protein|nr:hypothetical protein [Bacteroidales bacterium]